MGLTVSRKMPIVKPLGAKIDKDINRQLSICLTFNQSHHSIETLNLYYHFKLSLCRKRGLVKKLL